MIQALWSGFTASDDKKGEDDGCLEEKEEKQVISLGRKRGDTVLPVKGSFPFGDQRNQGGSPDPGGEDRQGQQHSLWCGRPGGEAERWGAGGRSLSDAPTVKGLEDPTAFPCQHEVLN